MDLEDEEINFEGTENKTKKINKNCKAKNPETSTYITFAFLFFLIIWTFIIAINKFYNYAAFPILFIPYASFGLGIINSDQIADDKIEEGIFSATFITMGLVISLPLLSYMNTKILNIDQNNNKMNANEERKRQASAELNHIIFLAMIATLLSYIHIWVDEEKLHVCKIIRSCLETIAVTLYIFALTIFFILT